ncbi:YciI-like protein [Vibrio aerogenes CECT 7868]|uniref:YciI-like protein n=1 Tax=Vibrio aerogenes CECT 7868 TaxID=1216006 RepID=A0A1M5ZXI5_9VIBR|nr:YciI family protein [Vibrio aerogenes]SHI28866.1 YciI-like protein [Vibrio aerogenes CECT 7868]
MFIVSLTYRCELSEIEAHLAAHIEYLEQQYTLGHFLASGRKVPRTGGVILADMPSKEALEAVLAEDPFKQHQLADYDVIEFIPTKTNEALSSIRQTL